MSGSKAVKKSEANASKLGKAARVRKLRRTPVLLGVAAVVGVLALTGCDKFTEPFKDAPRSGNDNNDPADVVMMPDGFSNWATKCDHGNRIYSAYHGDSAYAAGMVVPADPSCKGE